MRGFLLPKSLANYSPNRKKSVSLGEGTRSFTKGII